MPGITKSKLHKNVKTNVINPIRKVFEKSSLKPLMISGVSIFSPVRVCLRNIEATP